LQHKKDIAIDAVKSFMVLAAGANMKPAAPPFISEKRLRGRCDKLLQSSFILLVIPLARAKDQAALVKGYVCTYINR